MSKDKALAFLKEHSPAVFSALQAGKYIQFDVLTFDHWKEGYKMPYAAHYNVLHSPQGLILEVLPPYEAERIQAYRIATAERIISDYLEQRKAAFEALHYPLTQATEREAVERALTDPTALHIEAPAGDISPSHTTPLHKSPSNFIAAAYNKRLATDNYYSEIHAEDPRKITTYPFLMAEALQRYAAWIDSKTQAEADKLAALTKKELPTVPTRSMGSSTFVASQKNVTMPEQTVLISLTVNELENLIIDCVNACLKVHNQQPQPAAPTTPDDPDRLINKKEAASLLGCSQSTIDNFRRRGTLKSTKLGKAVRFRRSDVLALC